MFQNSGSSLSIWAPNTQEPMVITLSMVQLRDLAAALNLPEGSYRLEQREG